MNPSDIELSTGWSFWCATPGKGQNAPQSWEMKKIFTFNRLNEFWRFFNSMKSPSEFGNSIIEIAVFREGIEPEWDHEPCSNGGRWCARLDRVSSSDSLDQTWYNLVLGAIGESIVMADRSQLLGVAFSSKGASSRRIALWAGVREKETVLEIGNSFKENLRMELSDKDIGEMLFHDFESGNKSYAVIANTGKKERKAVKVASTSVPTPTVS
jgi:hypothetical protein